MAIETRGLFFSYPGKRVLDKVDIAIEDGDFVGITGPTGSGKTTLAYCFNGLIPHSIKGKFSGSVTVNGLDTRKHRISEIARHVGLVFQDPEWQIFSLSVNEEIAFGLHNLKMKDVDRRVKDAIRSVGLEGYGDTEPHKLSQGQKQKICIASVLAMEPSIIVLDEPTSALDYRSSMNIYGILKDLNKQGKTVIVIEHDTDLLAEYTNKMLLLDGGRISRQGKTKDVLSDKKELNKLGVKVPGVFRR